MSLACKETVVMKTSKGNIALTPNLSLVVMMTESQFEEEKYSCMFAFCCCAKSKQLK